MDLYANPTITDFQQDVNGDIKMLKIGVKKEDAFANIQGQATGKVENNKTATINVSTYTQPVEITPTAGKNSMKKATVTLSNIPSGSATAYAWKTTGDNYIYSNVDTAASTSEGMKTFDYMPDFTIDVIPIAEEGTTYTRVSDTEFTLSIGSSTDTYTRDSTKDLTIW